MPDRNTTDAGATSALNIISGEHLAVESISGRCVAVLGVRGSGKSSTAAVICEELARVGHPFIVLDVDSEYGGLREKFEVLVAGAGPNVDVQIAPTQTAPLAEIALRHRIPVLLDMAEWTMEEGYEAVYNLAQALWTLEGETRTPCALVLEEAHEWVPEGVRTDLKDVLTRITLRGRKRGLSGIIVSQRSAKVAKDILSQAEILFLHKVVHPSDVGVYQKLVPGWTASQVELTATSLEPGTVIYVSDGEAARVAVRPRQTIHGGDTPTLGNTTRKPRALKAVSQELIDALQRKVRTAEKDPVEPLRKRIRELEAALSEEKKRADDAEESARTLGYLRLAPMQPEPFAAALADKLAGLLQPVTPIVGAPAAKTHMAQQAQRGPIVQAAALPSPILRHLRAVEQDIRALPAADRAIVRFLVDRAPAQFTLRQMAAWLEYRTSSLEKNPPSRAVALGIVRRTGTGLSANYHAELRRFVEARFEIFRPAVGADMLHSLEEKVAAMIAAAAPKA